VPQLIQFYDVYPQFFPLTRSGQCPCAP